MILPFSLSKPQRNGEFFIKSLFVVYLVVWQTDPPPKK